MSLFYYYLFRSIIIYDSTFNISRFIDAQKQELLLSKIRDNSILKRLLFIVNPHLTDIFTNFDIMLLPSRESQCRQSKFKMFKFNFCKHSINSISVRGIGKASFLFSFYHIGKCNRKNLLCL